MCHSTRMNLRAGRKQEMEILLFPTEHDFLRLFFQAFREKLSRSLKQIEE